jgi:hypothetical protein
MIEVSDILRDRMHESSGLQRMIAVSLAAHVIVAAAFVLSPSRWFSQRDRAGNDNDHHAGGGGEGPRTGSTPMGGRPVQVQTPPAEVKRPEPSDRRGEDPEMTLPTKAAAKPTRVTTPPATVTQAPDEARGRTHAGAETSAGRPWPPPARAERALGCRAAGAARIALDVANFCCRTT